MAKRRRKEKRLSMRKIREILRLSLNCNMGVREIAHSCSSSPSTVSDYINKASKANLSYKQIEQVNDGELIRLMKSKTAFNTKGLRPQPECEYIHKELRKKGVTMQLLWEEYKDAHPEGYQSSQFYELYSRWKKKLRVSMRQTHKAGEKMFVDYAGQTVPVNDRQMGDTKEAQLFLAVLGASNYTYAECTWSQGLSDWINSHVRSFEYFGGVSEIIVPDNLKSGVTKPCRYDPDINKTYHDLSIHYGTVIIPARVRKPKDKAKAEVGVQIAERWILAALRNHTFFSLADLNAAIRELLEKLNNRSFKKLPGSRQSWFEDIERDALLPLPESRYVFAEWKKARVNIDYHIDLNRHYYSVPYKMAKEMVEIRYTSSTVEVFYRGKRIASHKRDDSPGKNTTLKEHMPKNHQKYMEWTPARIISWAETVGESTSKIVETIMNIKRHPEQGYRSCMGVMRLSKEYSNERLEAACSRAIVIGGMSYKSVRSILENGLDQERSLANKNIMISINHENIRGGKYFN